MSWSAEVQRTFSDFMADYVRDYAEEIDCGDLALSGLAAFAAQQGLPIRLFDYEERPRRWLNFNPATDDWQEYRRRIMRELGAINIIENSWAIPLEDARAGDLIMTQHVGPGSTGHTRIITSWAHDDANDDYHAIWYQGNLPPVVPERRENHFRSISNVYGAAPRRWRFDQFA